MYDSLFRSEDIGKTQKLQKWKNIRNTEKVWQIKINEAEIKQSIHNDIDKRSTTMIQDPAAKAV